MPKGTKKKKKGSKKKKTTTANPDEDAPKIINDKPEYRHPLRSAPIAKLTIELCAPNHQMKEFKLEVPTSTRLYMIQRKICEQYGGSISGITICVHQYDESQVHTDPTLTLADIGIQTDGEYQVYYDFKVNSSPLLNSALTYKVGDEKV